MPTARFRTRNHGLAWTGLMLGAMLTGLASCVSPGAPALPGQPVALSPGEQVRLPDASKLLYLGVTADSRCPPDAKCVSAGDAEVAVAITDRGAPTRSTSINTANPEVELGRWRLRLVSLEHGSQPRLTLQVDQHLP